MLPHIPFQEGKSPARSNTLLCKGGCTVRDVGCPSHQPRMLHMKNTQQRRWRLNLPLSTLAESGRKLSCAEPRADRADRAARTDLPPQNRCPNQHSPRSY